ncbi:MAG: hypothetical protein JJ895_06025 [Balneolaceae bacterium]|nr:hypothetical protein [Balneolaceae bacterium]
MRNNIFWGILIITLFAYPTQSFAQDYDYYDELEYRKWRVTLIGPISTNGTRTTDFTAKRSINLLGGYHGALDGWEVGLLYNGTKYYSAGLQIAGITNFTRGTMEGFNIAGLANVSNKTMAGLQVAGVLNYSNSNIEGLQATMGINMSRRSTSGLQAAGIANISGNDIEGLQAAGIINASKGDISGLQAAGVMNIAKDNVEGLQASGILNFAGDDLSGMQATFGANIALGDIEGLFASGAFNFSRGDASGLLFSGGINVAQNIEGLSIAGVGNFAKDLMGVQSAPVNFSQTATGVQIGILNIAKEFEGVPLGVLSIYGNGRKNIDVRFSDGGFTDFSLTTGTHRVYNMAMFGVNSLLDRDVYRIGFAVGLEKNIQDSFEKLESTTLFVNQEFSAHHVFEGDFDKTLNMMYSYKYLVGNRFGNGLSLYGGPSVNMQVSRVTGSDDYSWYSVWSPSRKGREYQFWVGFTIGVRMFKQMNLPLLEDDWDRLEGRWDW